MLDRKGVQRRRPRLDTGSSRPRVVGGQIGEKATGSPQLNLEPQVPGKEDQTEPRRIGRVHLGRIEPGYVVEGHTD